MNVKSIEQAVISALVKKAYEEGYEVRVHNGEEMIRCTDHDNVMDELFSVDDEYLLFYKDNVRKGWALLVHGNSGWDVIADHTTSIDCIMEEANKVSDLY